MNNLGLRIVEAERAPCSPPKSYTLAELKDIIKLYVESSTASTALEKRLEYSRFLAWLARREREGRG